MTRHDLPHRDPRPHVEKSHPADDRGVLAEFARTHHWCQACGRDGPCTIHHLIGGRGGRSDEACNLLYLCWQPCHMLAEGLDVRVPADEMRNNGTLAGYWYMTEKFPGGLLPKITLAIALQMKVRAGELRRPILLQKPASVEVITSPEWDRLTLLHGRNLPAPEAIPEFFTTTYRRNRPELHQ